MEVTPGYKQTEVGFIPADWKVSALGMYGRPYGGLTGKSKPDFGRGSALYVTFLDVMDHVVIDGARLEAVAVAVGESQNTVQFGDLLFTGSSETPEEVAMCALVAVDKARLYLNSFCFGLRLYLNEDADGLFLTYLIRSGVGRRAVVALAQGSTRYNISKRALLAAPLPLPGPPEQRAIAAALSDVDALLGGLDRLIAKKRNLKQAAMQQLLTGQTRLPGFSGEWEVKPLTEIVSTPITDGPHLTPTFLNDGIPFLSVNNLVNNKLDLSSLRFVSRSDHEEFSKKCRPRRGDILFGKAASVGQVALLDTGIELNIWSPLALIRVGHKASAQFVVYALQTRDVHRQIALLTNASSQGNIGMSDIGRIAIPVPSLSEQNAIAAALSDMDAELSALEARRAKTRDLKQAMMQELLTGKTRLVPAGAAHA